MNEPQELHELLNRCNRLGDRVCADICKRIQTHKGLDKLDGLFTLSERNSALFNRIYARLEAARRPEDRI